MVSPSLLALFFACETHARTARVDIEPDEASLE